MNKIELMEIIKSEMLLAESVGEMLKMVRDLAKLPIQKIAKLIRNGGEDFAKAMIASGKEDEALAIINKKFHTNYKSLNQIDKLKIIKEDAEFLEEDFKHYIASLKDTVYSSSLIMGMLSVGIELGKLFTGDKPNYKALTFYAILWLILSSAKYFGEGKEGMKTQKVEV